MEIIAELYVCEKCSHIENELYNNCPECGGIMRCTDFVPAARIAELEAALREIALLATVARAMV